MKAFVAEKLRELREKNGWTIENIAKITDTTTEEVEKWEAGTAEPTLTEWIILAKLYQTTSEHAFGQDAAYELLSDESKAQFGDFINAEEILKQSLFR